MLFHFSFISTVQAPLNNELKVKQYSFKTVLSRETVSKQLHFIFVVRTVLSVVLVLCCVVIIT